MLDPLEGLLDPPAAVIERPELLGQLGVAYDLVPERLNLGATVAAAANAKGDLAGAEVNLRLEGQPLPFFKLGATGAMVLGTTQRFNPWIVFADLEWVVF